MHITHTVYICAYIHKHTHARTHTHTHTRTHAEGFLIILLVAVKNSCAIDKLITKTMGMPFTVCVGYVTMQLQ